MFLRTRLVSKEEWRAAHLKTGSIYFIRDAEQDCIKVGHSKDPWSRLRTLQVGSSSRLGLIGVIAAPIEIEAIVHNQLKEGSTHGEWFLDRGVTTQWLMSMTQGDPICRHIWSLEPERQIFWMWDEEAQRHTKHIWDLETNQWDPPIK
jgi:hypothetical protein